MNFKRNKMLKILILILDGGFKFILNIIYYECYFILYLFLYLIFRDIEVLVSFFMWIDGLELCFFVLF